MRDHRKRGRRGRQAQTITGGIPRGYWVIPGWAPGDTVGGTRGYRGDTAGPTPGWMNACSRRSRPTPEKAFIHPRMESLLSPWYTRIGTWGYRGQYQGVPMGNRGNHPRMDECVLPSVAAQPPRKHLFILGWGVWFPPGIPLDQRQDPGPETGALDKSQGPWTRNRAPGPETGLWTD